MRLLWVVLLASACGDNDAIPTWQGATRLASMSCQFSGTAIDQVAVDDTSVYWAGGCEGGLHKTVLAGGATTVLATKPAGALEDWCVHGVQLHDDDVYFTTGCGGGVGRVSKAGGASSLVDLSAEVACVHSLVASDDTLYISSSSMLALSFRDQSRTVLSSTGGDAIALRSNALAWIGLAEVTSGTYTGALEEAALPGGTAMLVTNTDTYTGLAATESDYVFTSNSQLQRFDSDHHLNVLAPVDGSATDIKIAGDTVYWIDASGVYKMPLAGGPVSTIATHDGSVASGDWGLTLDAQHVYWTDGCGLLGAPR